jgi:hypothetical protein
MKCCPRRARQQRYSRPSSEKNRGKGEKEKKERQIDRE